MTEAWFLAGAIALGLTLLLLPPVDPVAASSIYIVLGIAAL